MSSAPWTSETPFHRVTVVGLGVMGGSLARDLSALGSVRVHGWSPDPSERRAAREAGAVAEAPARLGDALAEAELVVLATPLSSACALLPEVGAQLPAALLTDVASLKVPLVQVARKAGLEDRWVGSHPMAGSEGSGFSASRAGLYRDARVWMVSERSAREAARRMQAFWSGVGARPALTDAEGHDRLMALASHLPQLAANALAAVLEGEGIDPGELGPGGRDMTRLAASSPDMWRDLLAGAPDDLPRGLEALAGTLTELAELVRRGADDELAARMERTRRWKMPPRAESEA